MSIFKVTIISFPLPSSNRPIFQTKNTRRNTCLTSSIRLFHSTQKHVNLSFSNHILTVGKMEIKRRAKQVCVFISIHGGKWLRIFWPCRCPWKICDRESRQKGLDYFFVLDVCMIIGWFYLIVFRVRIFMGFIRLAG